MPKSFFPNNKPSLKRVGKCCKDLGKFDGISVNGGYSELGQNGPKLKPCSEGVLALLAPARYGGNSNQEKVKLEMRSGCRGVNSEKSSNDHSTQAVEAPNVSASNKLSKVKLKLGGATRHAKSDVNSGNASSLARTIRSTDFLQNRQKLISQDNDQAFQENPWKDIDGSNFLCETKESSVGQVTHENLPVFSESIPKRKRVPKRQVLDSTFDNHDNGRWSQKLSSSKFATNYMQVSRENKVNSTKRKTASIVDREYGLASQSTEESKKMPAYGRDCNDTYYAEKEEKYDCSLEESKRKKQKKVSFDSSIGCHVEHPSTHQHSLQLGKNVSFSSLIEFPNGLPPAPQRNQKEKLSAEQQQAKKAEAAQRCKVQREKADRESESRAMRKILGVDSDQKKAEEQRMRAEKAKDANSRSVSSCTVRLVMGTNGTLVTFPEHVGLPSIFLSKSCSHPPRETCAGPSCTNSYKYRDSRSNPLCSLQCYRAVQGSGLPMTTC